MLLFIFLIFILCFPTLLSLVRGHKQFNSILILNALAAVLGIAGVVSTPFYPALVLGAIILWGIAMIYSVID